MSFDWGSVLGLAGNAASGGVLGLVGSLGSGVVSYFNAKAQQAHEIQMGELNLRLIQANSDAASKLSADQLKGTMEKTAGEAFIASQQAGAQLSGVTPTIGGIIQLYRPFLCTVLFLCTFYFYETLAPQDGALKAFIVTSVVNLTSMAISWWWGSRQMEKFISSKPSN